MGCGASSRPDTRQSYHQTNGIEQQRGKIQRKNDRKHIMLSYEHNDQQLVSYVYDFLQRHDVRLWMDVKDGMEEHVLESEIAAAVENSAVVVCFLTQKYQDSNNCKDEFQYAKKINKPIIPCLINSDWRPSGWLDMDIDDSVYVNFSKVTDFNYDPKCEELLERIKEEDYFINEDDATSIGSEVDLGYAFKKSSNIHKESKLKTKSIGQTKLTKHVYVGHSAVRLILMGNIENQVHVNQEYCAQNGKFLNSFFIRKVIFQNAGKVPISVSEITAQYKDIDGMWRQCQKVKIHRAALDKATSYKWLPKTTLDLEPFKAKTFVLRIDVEVHGKPGLDNEHRARAHKSLPQPFKIRLRVQDTENKTVGLVVEQLNEPFELPTKEKLMKRWNYTDVIGFVYADDYDEDQRYWVFVHYEEKLKLRFSFSNNLSSNETKYLDTWLIRQLCNQAKRNSLTEIILADWNNDWRKIVALFDQKTFNLYGFRIELTTPTSEKKETILLPLDKIAAALATENSTLN